MIRFKFFGFSLIFMILVGCSSTPPSEEKLFSGDSLAKLAERMKNSGDYGSAIRLYRQALLMDPNDPKIQLGFAEVLRLEGKFSESREVLDKIHQKNPDDMDCLRDLGKIAIAQNDAASGLKIYQKLLSKNPQDAQLINGYAICHDLENHHSQAQVLYEKAIALNPEDIEIQANYGLSLALDGQKEKAIPLLEKLAHRSNATPHVKHNLAVAYGLAGYPEKARSIFGQDLPPEILTRNMQVLSSLEEKRLSTAVLVDSDKNEKPVSALTFPSQEGLVSPHVSISPSSIASSDISQQNLTSSPLSLAEEKAKPKKKPKKVS